MSVLPAGGSVIARPFAKELFSASVSKSMVTTLAWASDAHPGQGINVSHECYYLIRNACGVEWATVMTDRNNKTDIPCPTPKGGVSMGTVTDNLAVAFEITITLGRKKNDLSRDRRIKEFFWGDRGPISMKISGGPVDSAHLFGQRR